ncbi:MAG TPA: NAD(P)H-binding protein [Thermoanaerobaculia bacterium]|nr:NAD(P)H-binding protein [Thermoanaerobaculia bacterium]
MKMAITGGTGFVGSHLANRVLAEGHEIVLISRSASRQESGLNDSARVTRVSSDLSDPELLSAAFEGCAAVAHCAGINREIGRQTFRRIHVDGTGNVVEAARRAGVRRIALMSFLRARPDCGSPYHESKWAAEEVVRNSGLDYTIVKAGMVYGRGDHMLEHLSRAFHTLPLFALVGFREKPVRPVAVEDVTRVLEAALGDVRLSRKTVVVLGPEELSLAQAVRRVSGAVGRTPVFFRAPLFFHYALAWVLERIMTIPIVSLAQVRILSEGLTQPTGKVDPLPEDLAPTIRFSLDQIRKGLPEPGGFAWSDLRCCPAAKA